MKPINLILGMVIFFLEYKFPTKGVWHYVSIAIASLNIVIGLGL